MTSINKTTSFLFLIFFSLASADVLLDDFNNKYKGPNDQCHIGESYGFVTWGLGQADSGGGRWRPVTDTFGTIITNGSQVKLDTNNYGTIVENGQMHVIFKTHLSKADLTTNRAFAAMTCDFLEKDTSHDFSALTGIQLRCKGSGTIRIACITRDIAAMFPDTAAAWGYYGFSKTLRDTNWTTLIIPTVLFEPEENSPAWDSLWSWDHGKHAVTGFMIQAVPDHDTLTRDSTIISIDNIILTGLEYTAAFGFDTIIDPALTPLPGDSTHFILDTTITLANTLTGSTMYYTTNGSTPDTSMASYTAPFAISGDTVLVKAIVVYNGVVVDTQSWCYFQDHITIIMTATPADSTHFRIDTTVSLVSAPPGATIHYTLDGSIPTSAALLYTGPFTINRNTMVRAVAYKTGYIGTYGAWHYYGDLLGSWMEATPKDSTVYTNTCTITIQTNDNTALSIYYAIDSLGTVPADAAYAEYDGPFIISSDTLTIYAYAKGNGYDSVSGSWTYFREITSGRHDANVPVVCNRLSLLPSISDKTLSITTGIPIHGPGSAMLRAYDCSGRLLSGRKIEGYGYHRLMWNPSTFKRGIYFFRVEHGAEQLVKKVLVP